MKWGIRTFAKTDLIDDGFGIKIPTGLKVFNGVKKTRVKLN